MASLSSLCVPSSSPLTSSSYPQTRLRRHHGRPDGDPNPLGICREPQACPLDEGGVEDGKLSSIFFDDQVQMTDSYGQGETALKHGETPVGCVLVYNDQVVGRGMNDTNRSMNVSHNLPSHRAKSKPPNTDSSLGNPPR